MTLNSHRNDPLKRKEGGPTNNEDFGDADIEWINDIVTKQKDCKAPISVQALRQEMASFHKMKGGSRNRDALASTWHGGSRAGGVSQRNHPSKTSLSTPTKTSTTNVNKSQVEPKMIPTMEELQTIMAAKLSYTKVKEVVQDHQIRTQPQPLASIEPKSPKALATIEDLKALMAQASAKSKNNPTVDDSTINSGVSTSDISDLQKEDSAKKTSQKVQPPKSRQDRPNSSSKGSLSPRRDSKDDSQRKSREGSKLDPLRSSRHRHGTSRSDGADHPTKQKIIHPGVDSDHRKIREPHLVSFDPKIQVPNDRQDIKPRTMGSASRGRNHHDMRVTPPSVSMVEKRRKNNGIDQRAPGGKAIVSGNTDDKEATSSHHQSSENRSTSLDPKPRNRAASRGRSQVTSRAESTTSSDRSRSKVRSTSGDRHQQRLINSDAKGKRRILKGTRTKQEIADDTHSGNDDVDHSPWMAASTMSFDDDWGNFRPKSTRPVLDANRAKKLAAADDKHFGG